MRQLTTDSVLRLTCIALERTCFTVAESSDGNAALNLPVATRFASIAYRGPEDGRVVLAASEGFVRNLAASLIGTDPTSIDVGTTGDDALREFANIMAGSIVREVGGGQSSFLIGLPSTCDSSAPLSTCSIIATVNVEGERLEVHWIQGQDALAA